MPVLTNPMSEVAANLADAGEAAELRELPSPVLEQGKTAEEAAEAAVKLLKEKERYTFAFPLPWTKLPARAKELYKGTFTSIIPTLKVKQDIGVTRATLGGGIPFEALDPTTRELNLMAAHLFHRLDRSNLVTFPEWAKNLQAIKNTDVLYELYMEVASHEAIFWG